MTGVAVVNASPLIYLARAGLLDLLKAAADEVIVPGPVATEILARGVTDPTASALADPWLRIVNAVAIPPSIVAWDLGAGESSVIAWALAHPPARAVIDDLAGRRCAESHGVRLRGTLGLVLLARKEGRVPLARPVLDRLRAAGMFLSERVIKQALSEVGE